MALYFAVCLALAVGCGPLVRLGYHGFVLLRVIGWCLSLPFAVDAVLRARRVRMIARPAYDRWWIYISLFLGIQIVFRAAPSVLPPGFLSDLMAPQMTYRTYYLTASSMAPTLQPGDYVVTDPRPRDDWRRGDIVVVQGELGRPPVIKRILGLPGDTIEFRDGAAYVNGDRFRPDYWQRDADGQYGPMQVPPRSYFVVGDNVNNSKDSRYIGCIAADDMLALVLYRVWGSEMGTEFVDLNKR